MSTGLADPEAVRLVADVGGTNARFALVKGPFGLPSQEQTLATKDDPDIAAAIERYLADKPVRPKEGAVAIANPITGDRIKMTNHHWAFSIEETRRRLGFERLIFLNDFSALAMSLPVIPRAQLEQVGTGEPVEGTPIGLLGAGTGLGVSGLIPSGDTWIPLAGEGGHVTMCAANEREAEIIRATWREHPHVSAERLLSGMGLENLYRACATLGGITPEPLAAADVTGRALARSDPHCVEALATFCAMLGSVAGNLALTLGARAGVYVGGGIVPRLGEYFARSEFRSRFEAKGRFRSYLAAIPTYVIRAGNPAFLGVAMALGVRPGA